jgi:hypothetical protein
MYVTDYVLRLRIAISSLSIQTLSCSPSDGTRYSSMATFSRLVLEYCLLTLSINICFIFYYSKY